MLRRAFSSVASIVFLASTSLGPLAAAGCSSANESETQSPETPRPGPEEWNREVTPPADAEAEAARAACQYAAGALPAETQGESRPNAERIPIDHIVVLMMENRSFDHYFQKLPEYGQPDADVAPADYSNPDLDGNPVFPFHDTQYCFVDTNHGWAGTHEQIAGGKMDGFVRSNEGHHEVPANGTLDMIAGKRAMAHYDHTDLPFYYWLANEFAIGDRYFASMPGPTWPNRMFLYAGTSFGLTSNVFPDDAPTLFDQLELRGVSWKIYATGTPGFGVFITKLLAYKDEHLRSIDDYFADAAAGTLPQVAFVDPSLGREGHDTNDEHPPAMAQFGERFAAEVIDALAKGPKWSRSVLFLTYDEHGGLYDHVPPPKACPPDDSPVQLDPGDPQGGFDRLGVRVPFIVVSPWAKKHFVSHRVYDHTSIVRFIQARHVMPALSARDANAEAPWDMFDFESPPHATPPAIQLPEIDPKKAEACAALFD